MYVQKKKNRKNLLLKITAAVFLIYAVGTLINLRVQISRKQADLEQLKGQYETQTQKNAALQSAIGSEITDEYITDIARDKLGYILPGERIFEDVQNK